MQYWVTLYARGLLLLSPPCRLLCAQLAQEKDHHISMLSREKEEEKAALNKRIDGVWVGDRQHAVGSTRPSVCALIHVSQLCHASFTWHTVVRMYVHTYVLACFCFQLSSTSSYLPYPHTHSSAPLFPIPTLTHMLLPSFLLLGLLTPPASPLLPSFRTICQICGQPTICRRKWSKRPRCP